MGIYVYINGVISKGYEIGILEEVLEKLKNGETDFTVHYPYGQGKVEVKTD